MRLSRKRRAIGQSFAIVNTGSRMWPFLLAHLHWPLHILKVHVKIMHSSTVNISKMVKEKHYYLQQIGSRISPFSWHIYI